MTRRITHSAGETFEAGMELGRDRLRPDTVVCFFGDLGAGKTTFIKGVVAGALGTSGDEVNSPTFTYLNIYKGLGNKVIYHFDLYRLRDTEEFLSMGFDEMFDAGGICCVEWSEKIVELIPEGSLCVRLKHLGGDAREIKYEIHL